MSSVTTWSRFLGISLRPWSGSSPMSLVLRGLITVAVCVALAVICMGMAGAGGASGTAQEASFFRGWVGPVMIALVIVAVIAALRIAVGVFDLVSRHTVTGTVVSVTERMAGDVLPRIVQRMIYERGFDREDAGHDRRRRRTELVLETADGPRQWTVRDRRLRDRLEVGRRVRLSVTPLAGHIARVDPV